MRAPSIPLKKNQLDLKHSEIVGKGIVFLTVSIGSFPAMLVGSRPFHPESNLPLLISMYISLLFFWKSSLYFSEAKRIRNRIPFL